VAVHGTVDNIHTRRIADYVSGINYDSVPEEVRERIKLLILDSLGCGLYGAQLPWSKILQDALGKTDTGGSTSVWGTRQRISSPHAVLINGSQVQSFELDDVHRVGIMHVGAVTLPSLIAVVESHRDMSGKDFLASAVAGYEIGPRVGVCMTQQHMGQGWHTGATLGVFSSAAAAARGLGLSSDQTVHALGIAGTQSAGLLAAQHGAMVKRMHAGRSSQSGFYGAIFAEGGFTGILDVFESPFGGFCSTFSGGAHEYDMDALSAGFGEQFETMRIALKFYSCVGSNHTTLDAIRDIQAEHPFTIDDLDKIVVHCSRITLDHVGWPYKPEGLVSAQLNLPFCVATLLLEGDVFVDQFTPDAVNNQERIQLAKRVDVIEDPEISALGSKHRHKIRVEVRLRDGRVFTETRESPKGSEFSFAPAEDIVAKFKKLTNHLLPEQQQSELIDIVLNIEKAKSARRLAELLRAPEKAL
jgi:2-methylcitrate dehydratase PrpD